MSKREIIKQSIKEETTRKYHKNANGKITIYLNDHMQALVEQYADYKSSLLLENTSEEVLSFPKFITNLVLLNKKD